MRNRVSIAWFSRGGMIEGRVHREWQKKQAQGIKYLHRNFKYGKIGLKEQNKKRANSLGWWHIMPVISALRRFRQQDHNEFETSLAYIMSSKTA